MHQLIVKSQFKMTNQLELVKNLSKLKTITFKMGLKSISIDILA